MMKIYYTQVTKVDNHNRKFFFKGPDVFATSIEHARLALFAMGKADVSLVAMDYLDAIDPDKIVQWDSLIIPSKIQQN